MRHTVSETLQQLHSSPQILYGICCILEIGKPGDYVDSIDLAFCPHHCKSLRFCGPPLSLPIQGTNLRSGICSFWVFTKFMLVLVAYLLLQHIHVQPYLPYLLDLFRYPSPCRVLRMFRQVSLCLQQNGFLVNFTKTHFIHYLSIQNLRVIADKDKAFVSSLEWKAKLLLWKLQPP